MAKITTALFDFDGVVADTEPLYDVFWADVAERYHIGISDFPLKIKGMVLKHIFEVYFSAYSEEETAKIAKACAEYELQLDFPEIAGSGAFLHCLKERNFKLGLVTSSSALKMQRALKKMELEGLFDTLVTADRVTRGKPDPMGYLLAASDLHSQPAECVVFEDSFSGIRAGTAAGMKVIGLATTNPAEAIDKLVSAVIPDFSDLDGVFALLQAERHF